MKHYNTIKFTQHTSAERKFQDIHFLVPDKFMDNKINFKLHLIFFYIF